jgi:NodT family efflux transporter outer membrane factor (OMF) lipoprotein
MAKLQLQRRARTLALLGTAGLAGCAVGPNFHTPAAPQVSAYTAQPLPGQTAAAPGSGGEAQRFVQGADVPAQWWTLFHSPAIDALVAQALKANPDLEAAKAALRSAKETYLAQRGALLPTVDLGANTLREKNSNALSPVLNNNSQLFSLQTAQVNIAYTLDVFGGIRRQTEAAKAQAEQQRFQSEAAYLTLTSNVVAAAIQEASLRAQVEAAREQAKLNRDALTIMRGQLEAGQIARADVAAQETLLAQAEQALAPLEKQLAQQRDLLAALTGGFSSQPGLPEVDLETLGLPQDLPVSLPAQLVRQRPDVRAAEANMHAASAEVGVAIANRLPNLTLGASAGGASTAWPSLLSNGNDLWSYSAGLAQPIFEGGALKHRQKAAEAAFDQAKAQYRSAVVSAFQNVADTLEALQADARGMAGAVTVEQRAKESLAITQSQLNVGQVDTLNLILAEQAYQQARSVLIQSRASRLTDTAALIQALGGGWWNGKGVAG